MPYAFFFVAGDDAITLRATSFEIDRITWRALADEVALAVADGAVGELPYDDAAVADDASATPSPTSAGACEYYSTAAIAALLEADPSTVAASVLNGSCEWLDATTGRYVVVAGEVGVPDGPADYRALYVDAVDLGDVAGVPSLALPGGGDSVTWIGGSDGSWTILRVYTNTSESTVASIVGNLVPRLTDVPG